MQKTPPYIASTKAGGFRFELDCERITQSDTWALADTRQRPLLLMMWFVAWQQVPCGSLPGDDAIIAARIGLLPAEFQQDKSILLRGWEQASDGRLYHGTLTEMVLEMIARKSRETERKANYRKRQKEAQLSHGTDTGQPRGGHETDADVTMGGCGTPVGVTAHTTTTTIYKNPNPLAQQAARVPDMPAGFAEFWAQYPKKRSKGDSEKVWKSLKPDQALQDRILQAIAQARLTDDWQKSGGQFVPYPATWLRAKGWEDVVASTESAEQGRVLDLASIEASRRAGIEAMKARMLAETVPPARVIAGGDG